MNMLPSQGHRPPVSAATRHGAGHALLGAATLLALQPVLAQATGTPLEQGLWLRLSQQQARADSTMRLDSSTSAFRGTEVDLESDLGLPQRKAVRSALIGLRWREHWRAELEHFSLKRERSDFSITRDYTVGDTVYNTSALIDTRFDSQVTRASLGYAFLRGPSHEAGVVLGVHATRLRFRIGGDVSASGNTTTLATEDADATAPLPTLGLFATWASPQWSLSSRVDWFSIRHRGVEGRLLHAQASVMYHLAPQLRLGLGYRVDEYRLEGQRDEFTGVARYRFNGPQLVFEAGF